MGKRSNPKIAQQPQRGKGPREATSLWSENRERKTHHIFISLWVLPKANVPKLSYHDGGSRSHNGIDNLDRKSSLLTQRMKKQVGIVIMLFSLLPLAPSYGPDPVTRNALQGREVSSSPFWLKEQERESRDQGSLGSVTKKMEFSNMDHTKTGMQFYIHL